MSGPAMLSGRAAESWMLDNVCVCVCPHTGDRPFLISGADDKTAKVWDYQTKACMQTLEGHGHNVSAVCFHPELPVIITGSEDGSVKIWHSHHIPP